MRALQRVPPPTPRRTYAGCTRSRRARLPLLVAALLLAAGEHLRALSLPHPTVQQVTEATGASRSRAYELRDALLAGLPSLLRPVGRPPAPPRAVDPDIGARAARRRR